MLTQGNDFISFQFEKGGEAEFILHYDNYPQVRSCNEKNHTGEGI